MKRNTTLIIYLMVMVSLLQAGENKGCNIKDSIDLSDYNYSTDGGMIYVKECKGKEIIIVDLYGESGNSKIEIKNQSGKLIAKEIREEYNVPYYVENEFDQKKSKFDTTLTTFAEKDTNFYAQLYRLAKRKPVKK